MTHADGIGPGVRGFVDWVRGEALPVWATRGFDERAGRFHERLGLDGRSLPVPHRAMVQARQIYVYAHAGALGWHPDGVALADRAMATLRREFCVEDGGCTSAHFSINTPDGAPKSIVRDAYTHAFILFGAAYLHRATGDPALFRFAGEVTRYVDRELADRRHGGLATDAGAHDAERLQNPQMHLLEAWLALAEAGAGDSYLDRARAIVTLLRERILRRDESLLPERFSADWADHPDPAVADVWEPGHHFEWAWLLRWYEDLTGEDCATTRRALIGRAMAPPAISGGLIVDQLGADGRVVRAAHRLWPHCEAIKAATTPGCGLGRDAALALGETAAAALFGHFLQGAFPGGWIDQVTPDGAAIVDYVPASSLYHLMLAAAVADRATTTPDPADALASAT